jgi:protein-S-isoprenylcysteine O-methyltransferase Ste14
MDKSQMTAGIRSYYMKTIASLVVLGVVLFACAGRLDWWNAWVYLACTLLSAAAASMLVEPDLLVERSGFQPGMQPWDKLMVILVARVGPMIGYILSALDVRFEWSGQLDAWVVVASFMIVAAGMILIDWAMAANRFFSGVVRIQKERGHRVVQAGPYGVVRHPGYAGIVLVYLATPLALGSYVGVVGGLLTLVFTVIRTALEDRLLQLELDGYRDYAARVRYRLLPGIW